MPEPAVRTAHDDREDGRRRLGKALRQSLGTRLASDRHESPFHSTNRPAEFLLLGSWFWRARCKTSQLIHRHGLPPVFAGNRRRHHSPRGVEERRALCRRRGRIGIRVQDVGDGSSNVRLIPKSNLFNPTGRREKPIVVIRNPALCVW